MHQGMKKGLAAMLSVVFMASLLLNSFSIGVFALNEEEAMVEQIAAQLEWESVTEELETEIPEIQPEETPVASAAPTQQPEATEEPVTTVQPETTETPKPGVTPESPVSAEPTMVPAPTVVPVATATPTPIATAVPKLTTQQPVLEDVKQQIKDLLEQSYSLTEMTESELEASLEKIGAISAMPATMGEKGQEDAELQDLLDQLADAQVAMESMRMAWQAKREGWLDQLPQTGKENSWRYQNGTRIDQNETVLSFDVPDGVSTFSAGGYWGIDVSHHQGVINWEAVKAAGIDFAIIRCGYGMNLTEQDDRQWSRNVSECERLGIPYGVYFYSYAMTADMAVEEGAHAVRLLEGHSPDLPVFYDLEENSQLVLGNSGLAEIARIFCDIVGSKGYDVGVYASLNWWNHYLTDAVFENWYRWVAEWRSSCSYNGRYEIWQYTSKGSVNGINGYVDMNYLYGTLGSSNVDWIDSSKEYVIHSALEYSMVLDVADESTSDGANVQLYSQKNIGAQRYRIEVIDGKWCIIRNVNSGKVLEAAGGGMNAGTNVQQWSYNGTYAQHWCFEDAGDGSYYIRCRKNGLYLDVVNGIAQNGTNVQLYTENKSTAQKFKLEIYQTPIDIEQNTYIIQSAINENKVIDIANASKDNGANIQLYGLNGSNAQRFTIYPSGDGYYFIRNVGTGKVLDVCNEGQTSGTNVQQWDANNSLAQQWKFVDAGNGYYYIQSRCNGLYLDISDGNGVDGANVQVYSLNKSNAQKFRLVSDYGVSEIASGEYMLSSFLDENKVLDVCNESKSDGGNVQLYSKNGCDAQVFSIQPVDNGYYVIYNKNSGKVLDVDNAGAHAGANVQQWSYNGSKAQQWRFENAGDGYYYIVSRCNGLYLDITNAAAEDHANIQVYTANQSSAQKFKFERMDIVQNGIYVIGLSTNRNMVLDISDGTSENGGNLQLYTANGTAAQQFRISLEDDGWYTIRNVNSQKLLDVQNEGKSPGTNVQQWEENGSSAQKWRLVYVGDGNYMIESKCNGLYLDVCNGNMQNGNNIQVYNKNDSSAQIFKLIKIKG